MSALVQFLAYQAVWFAAVIGAGDGTAWPGVLAAGAFVVAHLAFGARRGVALRLVVLALALGSVVDGAFATSGLLAYAAPWPSPPGAPGWILALWAAFAVTFVGALAFVQARPFAAFALGAVFGPLAYLGAARLEAVAWVGATPLVASVLAVAWGAATWGLAMAARKWSPTPAPASSRRLAGAAP